MKESQKVLKEQEKVYRFLIVKNIKVNKNYYYIIIFMIILLQTFDRECFYYAIEKRKRFFLKMFIAFPFFFKNRQRYFQKRKKIRRDIRI